MSQAAVEPLPHTEVDRLVSRVVAHKQAWKDLKTSDKRDILVQLLANLRATADEWAAFAARNRHVPAGDSRAAHSEGAAWYAGVAPTASLLNGLIRTFDARTSDGLREPPGTRELANGRQIVKVFPARLLDRAFAAGVTGELWLKPGSGVSQGRRYRQDPATLCLILGAGNYEAPLDILTKMFGENRVVVYKPNPVNAGSAQFVRQIMKPLIDAGYLAIAPPDLATAQALLLHEDVDEVLMTGGCSTYDRIVWGPPDEQDANKKAGRKQMTKPFEAELGGSAPVVVVPGVWTDKQIDHHAGQIAVIKASNGSHICASPQVILTSRHWPQRKQFLDRVRHFLSVGRAEPSFYPGAVDRQQAFIDAYPDGELLGPRDAVFDCQLQRLFATDVDPDSLAIREEAFCPVLVEVMLDAEDPKAFLDEAAEFCNERLFGSLSSTVLVHPDTQKALGDELDAFIDRFEYGTIGINAWGLHNFLVTELAWGAFPKHTPEDIQSGVGFIGNAWMVDDVEKSVYWSDFVSPGHFQPVDDGFKTLATRAARYQLQPGVGRLTKVLSAVLLGL